MSTLSDLLAEPSVENWKAIVEIGKKARRVRQRLTKGMYAVDTDEDLDAARAFFDLSEESFKHWPPEIERVCPAGWPREFRDAIEHRVRETDTYGHYLAKICAHPDLRLADGSQAVWLERRFTGGVIPVSTAQSALRLLSAALAASSTTGQTSRVKQAMNLLASGVRTVGKVGCADLTGGVVIETTVPFPPPCRGSKIIRTELRLEIEVKVGDEEQRPEQIARMRSVRARGGCYVLCRSVEDAVAQIKAFVSSRAPG